MDLRFPEKHSCECKCSRLCLLSHSRCWSVFRTVLAVIHVGERVGQCRHRAELAVPPCSRVPSMAVLPLCDAGVVSEVWDSWSFLGGAVPGTAWPCCRGRALVCHLGSSPSVQTEVLCCPSFPGNFLVPGGKPVIVPALAELTVAELK